MSLWNSFLLLCRVALMIFFGVHGCSMERAANRNVSIQKDARNYTLPNASRPFQSSRPIFKQVGEASWYGPGFHGEKTANGEIFNQHKLTAAHRTLPLGTKVKVTNFENGNSVEVTINDRGPYVEGRVIDLSRAAARQLGMEKEGITVVKIEANPERHRSQRLGAG